MEMEMECQVIWMYDDVLIWMYKFRCVDINGCVDIE